MSFHIRFRIENIFLQLKTTRTHGNHFHSVIHANAPNAANGAAPSWPPSSTLKVTPLIPRSSLHIIPNTILPHSNPTNLHLPLHHYRLLPALLLLLRGVQRHPWQLPRLLQYLRLDIALALG